MKKRSSATLDAPVIHRPTKRLGQNFLVNQNVVQRILTAVNPHPEETIVEVGPGKGALTAGLIEKAGRVIAIEFDRELVSILLDGVGNSPKFTLVAADALGTDICSQIQPVKQCRIVANLPYNISTALLQRFLEQRNCITEMVLMLQKEVVERITAAPGSGERGYLSVLVETYCEAKKLFDVSPGSFRPAPKVWSSVVRLCVRPKPVIDVKNEDLLWSVVSAGFAQRRKTIFNNLRNATDSLQALIQRHGGASIVLCRANVDLQRRAETLSLEEWSRIVRAME